MVVEIHFILHVVNVITRIRIILYQNVLLRSDALIKYGHL